MMEQRKVLLVTSGQPSLNPRLVKEADALSEAGYEVTVLYSYWNKWGTEIDSKLIPQKKWKSVRVGGAPDTESGKFFRSRLLHKIARKIFNKIRSYALADIAIARSSYFLTREAKKYKADIYISHNLGSLPAVVKAAKYYGKHCGFDAEDFHRNEVTDNVEDIGVILKTNVEQRYIPQVDYWTASSPLISEAYHELFPTLDRPVIILNVLEGAIKKKPVRSDNLQPLKLFWFSQTVGPSRGLEMIIDAINISNIPLEFHLLGDASADYAQELTWRLHAAKAVLYFHKPVIADTIPDLATQFDIGLASETGFSNNNRRALSNKLFTYIQCGLAVVASDTPAQKGLMNEYPEAGKIYKSFYDLADIIKYYHNNRDQLYQTKIKAFETGQNKLNWDIESKKFLAVIEMTLGKRE